MDTLKNRKIMILLVTFIISMVAYFVYFLLNSRVDNVYMISSDGLYSYNGVSTNALKVQSNFTYLGDSINFTDKGNIFYSIKDGNTFYFELYNIKTNQSRVIRCDDLLDMMCEELNLDGEKIDFFPSICYFKEETQAIFFSIKTCKGVMRIIKIDLAANMFLYTREIGTYGDAERNPMYFGVTKDGEVLYGDVNDKKLYKYDFQKLFEEQVGENVEDLITSADGEKLFYLDHEWNAFVIDGETKYALGKLYNKYKENNGIVGYIMFSDKGNYICVNNYKMINDFGFKPVYIPQVYMVDYRNNKEMLVYSDKKIFFDGAIIKE